MYERTNRCKTTDMRITYLGVTSVEILSFHCHEREFSHGKFGSLFRPSNLMLVEVGLPDVTFAVDWVLKTNYLSIW